MNTPSAKFAARSPRRGFAIAALLLAACAGGPVPPDWQANAQGALAGYTTAWLNGEGRVADAEFRRARGELARTGRADLVARAELTRCALQLAVLDLDSAAACPGFTALAADADAATRAYAAFLAGRAGPADIALLPEHYRAIAAGNAAALARIEAPLARLVAAGALLRAGTLPPAGVDTAVDTASAQGWRRALLAWLTAQARLAEARGDAAAAAAARRRMAIVEGTRQ